jgi:hypothetical protein
MTEIAGANQECRGVQGEVRGKRANGRRRGTKVKGDQERGEEEERRGVHFFSSFREQTNYSLSSSILPSLRSDTLASGLMK